MTAQRFLPALALLFPLLAQAGEMEWGQFRGPTGQGISAATSVPTTWSATEGVAWKADVPGTGWSSPVVSKGKVYLTAAVPDKGTQETTLHALCFGAVDGKLVWDTEVIRPDPASVAAMHHKNSPASATPVVTADRLFVHFGHMGTAALDLNGRVVWKQTSLGYAPTHGNGGSPALVGDDLIFSADGDPEPSVIALHAATGELHWKTERHTTARKHFSFSTPLAVTVGQQRELISAGSGFVAAYDPADGRELWKVKYGEGYSVVPRPVFAHGLLFLSSGFDSPSLYAVRPEGAKGDATATNVAWTARKGAPLTPSMLVVGDELYFVSDNGVASCADAKTGNVHWSQRLGGDYSASPVVAEGRIIFLSEGGVGSVVKVGTNFELLAKNELGERTLASPAVVDGALFLRSEGHLWKITGAAPVREAALGARR